MKRHMELELLLEILTFAQRNLKGKKKKNM